MKQSNHIDEKLLDRIIKSAYGDGNIVDIIIVWFRSQRSPEVKKLVGEYKSTVSALDILKKEKCPVDLTERIDQRAPGEYIPKASAGRFFDLFLRKPLISAAAAVLITGAASFYLIRQNKPAPRYSNQQVALAEKQVKESLALIDRVFQNTRRTLEDDVIKKQVSPPLNEGINTINNLFKGG